MNYRGGQRDICFSTTWSADHRCSLFENFDSKVFIFLFSYLLTTAKADSLKIYMAEQLYHIYSACE